MEKRAFDFVPLQELGPKPRTKGVIEIRGSYYAPVGVHYLNDLFAMVGDYIDGFKFAGGSQRLHPVSVIKQIIKLCHDYGIYVSTGGFIERVAVEGARAIDRYLEECKSLEFDVVEVSSGLATISLPDKIAIVHEVHNLGLKAKPEISFMLGAGAGTKVLGYKRRLRSLPDVFKEADAYLKAKAYMLMFESEGVTEDLPAKQWRTDLIKKLAQKFGTRAWMFEAAEPAVFKWYLQTFGPEVNLFIDHSQVFEFNAWRFKIWGDPRIWKGKKISYR